MKSKIAYFTYKCRRCGIVFKSNIDCNADQAEMVLTNSIVKLNSALRVPLITTHECKEHSIYGYGIADLEGCSIL